MESVCRNYRLMYGCRGWYQSQWGLGPSQTGVLVCQSEVAFCRLNGLGEVLAHKAGCEAWPGGEENCVNGFSSGIKNGAKTGLVE